MKKRILSFALAGLLLFGLAPTAGALYIGTSAEAIPAGTASQQSSYFRGEEDAKGIISFGNIESRMRANNPTMLSVQATLDSQKAFDRKAAYDKILKGINDMVDGVIAATGGNLAMAGAATAGVSSMRAQLDAISEKNWAETMEKLDRQLSDTMYQLVMAGESLYVNVVTYENNLADLERAIQTMEQTMGEMELRYQLGQISKLTLEQFKTTYASTKSQAESLRLGISNMKATLENFLGEPVAGTINVLPLPETAAGEKQIFETDIEKSLLLAKEKSFTLFQAANTLEDAADDWKDAKKANPSGGYSYKMAEQTYQAAVHTHDAAIKSYELSFRNLYQAVVDAKQVLSAAEGDLRYQQTSYDAQQKRHDLGQISDSALRTAYNDLLTKKSAVAAAEISLFTAYHNYSWAVSYGIVPSAK